MVYSLNHPWRSNWKIINCCSKIFKNDTWVSWTQMWRCCDTLKLNKSWKLIYNLYSCPSITLMVLYMKVFLIEVHLFIITAELFSKYKYWQIIRYVIKNVLMEITFVKHLILINSCLILISTVTTFKTER